MGAKGDNQGVGNNSLNTYFPQAVFTHNVIADGPAGNGGNAANYPPNNFFPATMNAVGYVNYVPFYGGDYHLAPNSLYHLTASDGADIGANIDTVLAYTAGAVPGIFPGCTPVLSAVAQPAGEAVVSVFPNPGGEEGFILRGISAEAKVEVWDGQGHLCGVFPGGKRVAMTGRPAGVYLIRVLEKNRVRTVRWVKG